MSKTKAKTKARAARPHEEPAQRNLYRLTETRIKQAKPDEKPYKLSDGHALFLLVKPNGAKLWRWRYKFNREERLMSLGQYPAVSLKEARDRHFEHRKTLKRGADPLEEEHRQRKGNGDTLKAIAEEWRSKLQHLADDTVNRDGLRLDKYIYPSLGNRPIRSIKPHDLLPVLQRIEERGNNHTAHRVRAIVSRIMRYAVANGKADRDITSDLRGALVPMAAAKNHAAMRDPAQVGALLLALDDYYGQPVVAAALRLAPYVFVRPGELRGAQWSEFDLDAKEPIWRIPPERMKMGGQHLVPLSTQAVAILKDLQSQTGDEGLVFPGSRARSRPISDNTLNAALSRIGYKDRQTAHGFRSIASTLLNEQGWHPDLIELQLAHTERNEVRAAYNKAQRLDERREMMQAWADYLDELKTAAASRDAGKVEAKPQPKPVKRSPSMKEPSMNTFLVDCYLPMALMRDCADVDSVDRSGSGAMTYRVRSPLPATTLQGLVERMLPGTHVSVREA